MPTFKTTIFNTPIEIKYEKNDKDKLIELSKSLNNRLKKFENLNGKVIDIKIIILAALSMEDDLMELKKISESNQLLSKDLNQTNLQVEKLNSEIINLKDKIDFLELEKEQKSKEYDFAEQEMEQISKKIENLQQSILSIYDE